MTVSHFVARLAGRESGESAVPVRRPGQLSDTKRTGRRSVVGDRLLVSGDIRGQGLIEIIGRVDGNIAARRVTVAFGARVQGSIIADEIEIMGTVQGPLTAINVALGATAKVVGKVTHHNLEVEEGAYLDGLQPWQPVEFFTG